jgi:uncharacterized phiE125 gp8 family phage protein
MTQLYHRGLVRISAPAAEPVTLSETKEFLRITHNDDDPRISDMLITARALAEQWLKRSLVTQTWKVTFENAISGTVKLPMGPVQSISSVATTTIEGDSTMLAGTAYALSAAKDSLVVADLIQGYRIDVTYVAGYGSSSQLPKPIKMGILTHVAAMFDGQAGLAPIPDGVLQYYMPFRELSL